MKEFIKKRPIISVISVGVITFFIICIPIGFYITFFWNTSISQDAGNWGTFGDYFGGTLNPILGFISFMALLYTIKLQRDSIELQNQELQATREELARSAQAQEASEKALAEQSNIFKQQQFETTFFSMLAHLHQLAAALLQERVAQNKSNNEPNIAVSEIHKMQEIMYSEGSKDYVKYNNFSNTLSPSSELVIFLYHIGFITETLPEIKRRNDLSANERGDSYLSFDKSKLIDPFHSLDSIRPNAEKNIQKIQGSIDSNHPNWNQFSLFLYETLRLIRTLSPIKSDSCSKKEKRYSDIVRASIHPSILQILAITTYRKDKESYSEYIELFERYAFLETMPFKTNKQPNSFNRALLTCISLYQIESFGNSEHLKELDEIRIKGINICKEKKYFIYDYYI